ncbi:MAG: S41 family peptidase [Defluviitaleaceae bacterium]|nr:S41 family peptidase [Defluviitaleaceae bacterium]MCL2238467.1 S41 family peptidase [Defluviitaleaceae bacterium]
MEKLILLVTLLLFLVSCGRGDTNITDKDDEPETVPLPQYLYTPPEPMHPFYVPDYAPAYVPDPALPETPLVAPRCESELNGTIWVRPGGETQDFSGDALLVVERLEEMHPNFVVANRLLANYTAYREEYLRITATPMTRTEFVMATQRFLAVQQDGHLARSMQIADQPDIGWWAGSTLFQDGDFIDHVFIARGYGLFLADENGISTKEIIGIGGIPITDIFALIDIYYGAYNPFGALRNRARYSRSELILYMAGAQIYRRDNQLWVELTLKENGRLTYMEAGFSSGHPSTHLPINNTYELLGDVMYISLVGPLMPSAAVWDEQRHRIRYDITHEIELAIEAAIADGIRNFIFDLRDNPGGSLDIIHGLFNAMDLQLPEKGVILRLNENNRTWLTSTLHRPIFSHLLYADVADNAYLYGPPIMEKNNPHNISLAVLTSERTFSAGVYFATRVADSGFGIVIGEPSATSPSGAGGGTNVMLPASGLVVRVTYMHFLRPDTSADPLVLWPDIMVNEWEALDAALAFFNSENAIQN